MNSPEDLLPPSAEADLRLSTFALRCWHALTQLDGPMWLSLRRLLACPGRAAAEHFEPGSALRVHPFRLYLAVNVLFFFLAPRMNVNDPDFTLNVWTFDYQIPLKYAPALLGEAVDAARERSGFKPPIFEVLLNDRMRTQQGALVWLLIPCVALASFAVARRRRRYLVEHLVLATNLVSFFLLSLLISGFAARGLVKIPWGQASTLAAIPLMAWLTWLPWSVYRSLRIFLELGRARSALTSLWVGGALYTSLLLYLIGLLCFSLVSLRAIQAP